MASKYDKILGNLPKMLGSEPERQAKVEALKAEILMEPSLDRPIASGALIDQQVTTIGHLLSALKDDLIGALGGRRHGSVLGDIYDRVYGLEKSIESMVGEIGLIKEAYGQILAEQYECEGISSLRLANGNGVFVQPEPYAQVTDRDKFREWCIKEGLERQLALPWQTTNSITKKMLLDGSPEPDGVTCYLKNKIVVRKG